MLNVEVCVQHNGTMSMEMAMVITKETVFGDRIPV